ncbi:preprotein translocase subunit YajC [soil metagenome]
MSLSFISDAIAATPAAGQAGESGIMSIVLLVGFVLIFYFLLWRPQSKRAKEQRNLLSSLAVGDEVVTSGGILGKINQVNDDFVVLAIADNVEIKVQKGSVAASLPKGTMKSN